LPVLVVLGASMLSAEERVPANAKVFVEGSETVDASNSKNKAKYGDFTLAITAALAKKKVPVVVVTDLERADYVIRHTSSAKEDSTGTKIAKIAIMGGLWGSSKFEASIMVIDKASTAVVYSYNVKKETSSPLPSLSPRTSTTTSPESRAEAQARRTARSSG
jgi:hypothetical protein